MISVIIILKKAVKIMDNLNNVPTKKKTKRKVKDSVFSDLFDDKKYLKQLYVALHPEDAAISEDDLSIITLSNILVNDSYNDLGFLVGNRLMVLVEAQSTWNINILIRGTLYLTESYREYFIETSQNI
jgi:hypothetical protein